MCNKTHPECLKIYTLENVQQDTQGAPRRRLEMLIDFVPNPDLFFLTHKQQQRDTVFCRQRAEGWDRRINPLPPPSTDLEHSGWLHTTDRHTASSNSPQQQQQRHQRETVRHTEPTSQANWKT